MPYIYCFCLIHCQVVILLQEIKLINMVLFNLFRFVLAQTQRYQQLARIVTNHCQHFFLIELY